MGFRENRGEGGQKRSSKVTHSVKRPAVAIRVGFLPLALRNKEMSKLAGKI